MAENLLSPDAFEQAINDLSLREVGKADIGEQVLLAAARYALRHIQEEGIDVVAPAHFASILLGIEGTSLNVRYGLLNLANQAYGSEFCAEASQFMLKMQDEGTDRSEAAS